MANLIGALIGISIPLWISARNENKRKEYIYGVIADQMAFEWKANEQYAQEISKTLNFGFATVRRFNLKVVESALEQPYIYEFAPKEFINKLRIYRENLLVANKLMDYHFGRNNTIEEVDKLKRDIQNIITLIDELGKIPMR